MDDCASEATMKTYWISMAPTKGGKARTVLVDAPDPKAANLRVHRLGLYQSGDEFYIIPIPPGEREHSLPRDRLLTEDELRSVGAVTLGEVSAEMEKIAASLGTFSGPQGAN